jgi:hypothetical protein
LQSKPAGEVIDFLLNPVFRAERLAGSEKPDAATAGDFVVPHASRPFHEA